MYIVTKLFIYVNIYRLKKNSETIFEVSSQQEAIMNHSLLLIPLLAKVYVFIYIIFICVISDYTISFFLYSYMF